MLGEKEYFIDLPFYHRFLKALVAFELKVGTFEPEYAGKMDFYLNLLNDKERAPDDNPSIGIILCAEKDDVEVEYALKTKQNPIGVAEYQLLSKLPAEMKGKLPTARELADAVRAALPGKGEEDAGTVSEMIVYLMLNNASWEEIDVANEPFGRYSLRNGPETQDP